MNHTSSERGMSLPIAVLVLAAVVGVGAIIFISLPKGEPEESSLRETDPAVSTLAACQAGCRDQYGGSGSSGFEACMRGCGAGPAAGARETESTSPEAESTPAPSQTPASPKPQSQQQQTSPTASPTTPPPAPQPTPTPAPQPQPAPKTVDVSIRGFTFNPASVTINAGDTVVFKNFDSVGHTATQSGGFDTGLLGQGQSKSITFSQKGTFNYYCIPHPYMTGTIIVE
ncbi:MAG: Protease inhibitor Kazal-type [Parcubacteria group bacterium GW2011_GWA2_51_10]|nr:MAG: Protease inhibitor Kazal-type [Parcubacteria group bacterium GW2011_GWA2_51_10]